MGGKEFSQRDEEAMMRFALCLMESIPSGIPEDGPGCEPLLGRCLAPKAAIGEGLGA